MYTVDPDVIKSSFHLGVVTQPSTWWTIMKDSLNNGLLYRFCHIFADPRDRLFCGYLINEKDSNVTNTITYTKKKYQQN